MFSFHFYDFKVISFLITLLQVLLGQQYTQKSDIHSLALVIWEIISAGRVVKFYTNNNRDNSVHQSQGKKIVMLCYFHCR